MSLATEADIRAAFKKFDVDGNGFLSLDELKALLQRSGGGKALTDDEVSEFMYRFDAFENDGNADGKLSIEELVNGLLASQLYTACQKKEVTKEMLQQASWKQLSWIGGPKQGPCKDVFRLLIEDWRFPASLLETALDVAVNLSGVGKDQLAIQLNKVMTRPANPALLLPGVRGKQPKLYLSSEPRHEVVSPQPYRDRRAGQKYFLPSNSQPSTSDE